mgnify:CR=1 FL=1
MRKFSVKVNGVAYDVEIEELGATANDVLVAAYIRSAYRLIGCDKNEKMSVYKDYVNIANLCFTHETSSHALEYNKLYVNTHHFYPSIAFKNASSIYLVFEVINSVVLFQNSFFVYFICFHFSLINSFGKVTGKINFLRSLEARS